MIEAAVAILSESGYAAASTTAVADRAGVSRGSIFHNFPSKTDLMLAVLDYVLEEDLDFYSSRLSGISSRRDYTLALGDISWEALSGPRGIAVMQIMLCGSGDPDLKARLPASLLRVHEKAAAQQQARAPVGPEVQRLRTAASRLHVAALRGLAMERITGRSTEDFADELALLKKYMVFLLDVLSPEASQKDRDARAAAAPQDA